MNSTLFPTIGATECRSYIAKARLASNAVALRIRQLIGPKLIRRCMYCRKDYGTKPCVAEMNDMVTHGICEQCVPAVEREFNVTLQRGPRVDEPLGVAARKLDDNAGRAASLTAAGTTSETNKTDGCGASGGTFSDLGVDAYHVKQATERSLPACENRQAKI